MPRAALEAAIERWGGPVVRWTPAGARLWTDQGSEVDVRADGHWLVLEPVVPTLPLFLWIRWRRDRPAAGSALARAYGWMACGVGFLQVGGGSVLESWLARLPEHRAVAAAFAHDRVRLADGQIRAPLDEAHVGDLLGLVDVLQPPAAVEREHLRELVRSKSVDSVVREVERQLARDPGARHALVAILLGGTWPQHRLEGIKRCLAMGGDFVPAAARAAAEVLCGPGSDQPRLRAASLLLQTGFCDADVRRSLQRGLRGSDGDILLRIVDATLALAPHPEPGLAAALADAVGRLLRSGDRRRQAEAVRRIERLPPGSARDALLAWAIGATAGDLHDRVLAMAARNPSEQLGKALLARAAHAAGDARHELLRIALPMHPAGVERLCLRLLDERAEVEQALDWLAIVGTGRAVEPISRFATAWFGPSDRKTRASQALAAIRERLDAHGGGLSLVAGGGELSLSHAQAGSLSTLKE